MRAGLIVMTDLGRQTVESILFGDDPAAARAALVATGDAVGRLHRMPIDTDLFAGIDTWTLSSRDSGWDVVKSSVLDLGLPPLPNGADDEQRALTAAMSSPGANTVMLHGDLTPNNIILGVDGQCRLIDFEGAGPQHIGIDACMLRFPFAWYGRWALVPADVQSAMEQAYRSSLAVASDEIDQSMAVGCMAMLLLRLERLPRIADTTQVPEVAFRRRVQIASTIEVAIDACVQVGTFPALVGWLARLLDAIRDRWTEANQPSPIFPAFRQPD